MLSADRSLPNLGCVSNSSRSQPTVNVGGKFSRPPLRQPAAPNARELGSHIAAPLVIASGVPLGVVSKTMRHSTLSITVDIHGHLTRHAAHQTVDAMTTTLNTAHEETLAA